MHILIIIVIIYLFNYLNNYELLKLLNKYKNSKKVTV